MSGMPKTSDGNIILRDAAEWFKHRSYDYRQFSDLEAMASRKRELGLTVSAVLPCRNVADTVGGIVDEIHAVNRLTGDNPLVARSSPSTLTRRMAPRRWPHLRALRSTRRTSS